MGVFVTCFLLSYFSYQSISSNSRDIQQIIRRSLIYTIVIAITLALIPVITKETSNN